MTIRVKKGEMCYAPVQNVWLAFGVTHCSSCHALIVDPDVEDYLCGSKESLIRFGYKELESIPPSFGARKDGAYLCKDCSGIQPLV